MFSTLTLDQYPKYPYIVIFGKPALGSEPIAQDDKCVALPPIAFGVKDKSTEDVSHYKAWRMRGAICNSIVVIRPYGFLS